jgi:hypothetical protein
VAVDEDEDVARGGFRTELPQLRQGGAYRRRCQSDLGKETPQTTLMRWGRGMRENQLGSGGFALI